MKLTKTIWLGAKLAEFYDYQERNVLIEALGTTTPDAPKEPEHVL
ncbi:MAG: hypothetical protein U5O39_07350 [Gammaproteobacteria bacterium]|nr:hypothetical protein [Gammaproteobacteria bacterium]